MIIDTLSGRGLQHRRMFLNPYRQRSIYPVYIFAPFLERLVSTTIGSESVAVVRECAFVEGTQHLGYGLLDDTVGDRGYTQLAHASIGLRNLDLFDALRFIDPHRCISSTVGAFCKISRNKQYCFRQVPPDLPETVTVGFWDIAIHGSLALRLSALYPISVRWYAVFADDFFQICSHLQHPFGWAHGRSLVIR